MGKSSAVRSLKARANEFRVRPADCAMPGRFELAHMHQAHLGGQPRLPELRIASQPPLEFEQPTYFNETDR